MRLRLLLLLALGACADAPTVSTPEESRRLPDNIPWTLTSQDVEAAERSLSALADSLPVPLARYLRRHSGAFLDGRRYLVVDAVPVAFAERFGLSESDPFPYVRSGGWSARYDVWQGSLVDFWFIGFQSQCRTTWPLACLLWPKDLRQLQLRRVPRPSRTLKAECAWTTALALRWQRGVGTERPLEGGAHGDGRRRLFSNVDCRTIAGDRAGVRGKTPCRATRVS